jgi:cytochrome b561
MMLDFDTKKSFGITSAILAWLVFFSFLITAVFVLLWGVADVADPAAHYWRALHMSSGIVVLIFVTLRLLWWMVNPRQKAPKKIPAGAYGLSRLTLVLLYIEVFAVTLLGLINSWVLGYDVSFLGLFNVPVVDALIQFVSVEQSRFLHNLSVMFFEGALLLYVLVNGYIGWRYRVGYRRMIPGMHV